jgi:hypothetical protein
MWIYTIANMETGEIMYYLISGTKAVYPGEGRGVAARRALDDVLGGRVMIDRRLLDYDLIVTLGKGREGDLLAQGLFGRS